ncbi:uncharacterized protein Z520_11440 [Fonsecaea multimorphosa CBS 102226]|uniref:Fumarylacetoacetase n=1 Tax=Fonsecaea multimorphosa CBS 102226 TaxID=1442371 RepID=A0A0D2JHW0_9EURO|nr:uncharacterized protein Z520_11440 [Fonsecaea multimorphosa CBS 102226]KIX92777.1 hypothetical protein Z520_11440 [Fonsecaea multimorphosa CBS 102226]OAL18025.1 hypothetical protein AYO22_11041 [Fonsecaea multimorphosa]
MDDESWVPIHRSSEFQLHNLPMGVFKTRDQDARIGVAIGDYVLDMKLLAEENVFSSLSFDQDTLKTSSLNHYASLGRTVHRRVRGFLVELLAKDTKHGHLLRNDAERRTKSLLLMETVQMLLPFDIPNYTDFFVGVYHAQNCVNIVRPGIGLNSNYFHLPIAYHGRASSVVVSDTLVRRPKGQYVTEDGLVFGPTRQMDFEVEFAAFIGTETQLGDSIDVNTAEDHIFGVVLVNDWSARDIQRWESPSLGPFNGKNFCTTVSPWVVSLDALANYRVETVRKVSLVNSIKNSNK